MEPPSLQLAFNRQEKEALCPSPRPRLSIHNGDGGQGPRQIIGRALCNQGPTWKRIGMIVLLLIVILTAVLAPVLLLERRRTNSNRRYQNKIWSPFRIHLTLL